MPQISGVIITLNEEKHIGQCLESLQGIADEIVVVDSFSTDKTEEICNGYGVRFIKHKFEGYFEQKNYAVSQAKFRHVLSLDADEALSDELRKSIMEVKNNFDHDGYLFSRHDNYCGRWLRHSRHNPNRYLRLFDSDKGHWEGPNPHDRFVLAEGSRKKRLKGVLLHWNYESFEDHLNKMNRFSTISAEELFKKGAKASTCKALIHMGWGMFRTYILAGGFLDGYLGLVNSYIRAHASFMKYAKLRKMNSDAKR